MEEKEYGHEYLGSCTGFGADPKCIHCGRTMSHVMECGVFECKPHAKYMKVMKEIEKDIKTKKEKEPAVTFANMEEL